eukprot:scaffold133601_cov21-Tisochrysis_lutea.AAC.1
MSHTCTISLSSTAAATTVGSHAHSSTSSVASCKSGPPKVSAREPPKNDSTNRQWWCSGSRPDTGDAGTPHAPNTAGDEAEVGTCARLAVGGPLLSTSTAPCTVFMNVTHVLLEDMQVKMHMRAKGSRNGVNKVQIGPGAWAHVSAHAKYALPVGRRSQGQS